MEDSGQMIDEMTEQAVKLLSDPDRHDGTDAGETLANDWPAERALHVSLALTLAANQIEMTLRGGPIAQGALMGYRHAALVAAEVAALESEMGGVALCSDLTRQRSLRHQD